MKRSYKNSEEALKVAKQAVFLAWTACGGTSHYGFLQDRGPNQTIDQVWDHAVNRRDYGGLGGGSKTYINCDYVMGRMMKLRFSIEENTITHDDYEIRIDYQSWGAKYAGFAALFDAAETYP